MDCCWILFLKGVVFVLFVFMWPESNFSFFLFLFLFCGIVSVHFDLIKILLAICGNYNHKHLIYLVHSFDSIRINLYSHHPSVIIIRHHRWIVGLLILALFNSIIKKKKNFFVYPIIILSKKKIFIHKFTWTLFK